MTTKKDVSLPEQFRSLEAFVADWDLANESERFRKHVTSTLGELQGFYDAMLPKMDTIIAHLDRFDVNELAPGEESLFHLALSFMEVAPAVELFNDPDIPLTATSQAGFEWDRFRISP